MTTNTSSAWLALLLSFLIAIPTVVLADDTEMFTTSANPNVLLMLDSTGSMSTSAAGTSVGDLDGDGRSNTRMDILWKVVYTLLNADLSVPDGSTGSGTTWTCHTENRIRTSNNPYSRIQVDGRNWSHFPSSGTIQVGQGSATEMVPYTSKSSSHGNYYFNFSPDYTFQNNYSSGTHVSYSESSAGNPYTLPYPSNHTEAMGSDYLNNLTTADESTLKARMGLLTFTSDSSPGLAIHQQVAKTAPNSPPFTPSYTSLWSTVRSNLQANGMTPAAQALQLAKTFFDIADNTTQLCRQDYAVMVTDGEDTAGGVDGAPSGTTSISGGVYTAGQTQRNNSVIHMASDLKLRSPTVKLFTVGVGVGTTADTTPELRVLRDVLRRAAEQQNAQATATEYTYISTHADNTSRGEGRAFFATDATELANSMRNIFQQISSGMYSFTAPTVASVRMTDRNYLYKASFTPATPPATYWEGHLEALSINADNTMTSHWDADNVLKSVTDLSTRKIYTYATTDNVTWSRTAFTTTAITPGMLGVDNTEVRDNVVNYVRGANHDNNAKLGDIFHSKPVVVGPPSRFFFDQGYSTAVGGTGTQSFVEAQATRKRVVYVGTNDGMLHAFLSGTYHPAAGGTPAYYDSGTGAELFGYIPGTLLSSIENFLPGDLTSHGYYVDSSPRVADVWLPSTSTDLTKDSSEWRTVLIGGLRKGGRGYFALDVTDPDASDYPKVLWEYTDSDNLGQTWSEPFIGKIRMQESPSADVKDRWVAIFGGGKTDTGAVGASLVVLDIATGTALKTFTSTDGIDNVVPASPTAVLDGSGYVKFVYASDLDGSVYKFDFRTVGLRSTGFGEWAVAKIFQASAGQQVYHRVEAGSITENLRYLFFGTGDQEFPVSNLGTGKFYAVRDTDAMPSSPLTETNLTDLSSSILSLTGGTVPSTQSGWFIDFATVPSTTDDTKTHSGEKVLSDPVVFYNGVYFTTFTPNAVDPCGGGGVARVYGLNMLNAGAFLAPITGETATTKVPYHVFSGGAGAEGGIPSSPSLSIYPSGQSSIFIGFSTGVVKEIKIDSPPHMKSIKSWKETF